MRRNCAPEPAGSGDPDDSTLDDEESRGSAARGGSSAPDDRRRRRRLLRLAVIAVVGALFFAGVGLYRRHQDRRIVALSVARARHLVRSDTWNGYRDAADLLAIRAAALDRDVAGSLHSFALAMLSLDYRGDGAAPDARREAADAPPDRSLAAPSEMRLASAALALRDARIGTAVEQLSSAGDSPMARVLRARGALLAGNPTAAADELAGALSADPRFPAALALRGDLLRRAGRGPEAREAYTAAIAESGDALDAGSGSPAGRPGGPPHARATFGLAKLALSGEIPANEATAVLRKLIEDPRTPAVERARGAMYLAALRGRLGDRSGAAAVLASVPIEGDARGWLEQTSAQLEVARGRYRVLGIAPAALVSASDDDPYVPQPPAPARVERAPQRPKLWGFKVHPAGKASATKKGGGPSGAAVKSGKASANHRAKKPARSASKKGAPASHHGT